MINLFLWQWEQYRSLSFFIVCAIEKKVQQRSRRLLKMLIADTQGREQYQQ